MKRRLILPFAAVTAAFAIAGCGGSDSSSETDPAAVAPAGSPVFVEATLRPKGTLKSNVDTLSSEIAGIAEPEQRILSELESSLSESDANVSYVDDIKPWLGEKGAVFFTHYDGDDFTGVGFVVQSTNASAATALIDKLAKSSDSPVADSSYEGVDYKVQSSDDSALGLVGDFLVFGEDEQTFKDAVEASQGESLADDEAYSNTISAQPSGSLVDIYVNIGSLIEQAGTPTTDQALQVLQAIGLDPTDSTALASMVPGSNQIEIDFSTDLGGGSAPAGDASDLLGTFPNAATAAFATPEAGALLQQVIDGIDESGLPPQVPPNQLKSTLATAGIDLDKLVGSIGDAGLFVEGISVNTIDTALVLTTNDPAAAKEAVANIGRLVRQSGAPGVTAVSDIGSGFSISSPEMGENKVSVVTKGDRIVIAYGTSAILQGLAADGNLSRDRVFEAAVASLGDTPISGFFNGRRLPETVHRLVSDAQFQEVASYLRKVQFIALGHDAEDGLSTTKLIVGFNE